MLETNIPMWTQEEEIVDEELAASPQLAPPTGPPRRPSTAVGMWDDFFHEIRSELGRFSWPTLNQVKILIFIVLSIIIFFGIYLNAVDWVLLLLGKVFRASLG